MRSPIFDPLGYAEDVAAERQQRNTQDSLAANVELARLNASLTSVGKSPIAVPQVAAALPGLQLALLIRALLQAHDALANAGALPG